MENLKNVVLKIYSEDGEAYIVNTTDDGYQEYPGSIDDGKVTFWITGIEDPYYDESREENWDFPDEFKKILEAGGDYILSTGYEGYEINVTIDLNVLKTLFTVEYN
jgi:hypothetical protein